MSEPLSTFYVIKNVLKERKFKFLFFLIIVVSSLGSLFAGVGIGMFIPVIELLSKGDTGRLSGRFYKIVTDVLNWFHLKPNLLIFIFIVFLCIFFQALLELMRAIFTAKLRDDITKDLRDKSFNNLMYISLQYYHNRKVGELTSILGDEALRGATAIYSFSKFICTLTIILIYIVVLFLISWQATVFAIILTLISVFSVRTLIKASEKLGQKKGDHKNLITTFCFENLSSYFLINIFNYQEVIKKGFFDLTKDIKHNLSKLSLHNALIDFYNTLIRIVAICILIYFLYEILHLPIGYLATVLLVVSQLAPRVNELNIVSQTFFENLPGLKSIYSLSIREDKPYIQNGHVKLITFKTNIEFRNVNFGYLKDRLVLHDINLKIEKGRVTAIIGASGSGKSTLIALIPRFYDVRDGEILIDGIHLEELDMYEWRNKIGFISQETFIYNDTIRNNLLLAKLNADEQELLRAVKLAHLDGFINSLPMKLETTVGDRGIKLSGGQKQRIAIARVFLKNPEILILDEATSSLDNISERLIQQSIDELSKDRTVIVIAHRLTTIKNADKILVLENGRIVEEGHPDELIKTDSHYNKYLLVSEHKKDTNIEL